MARTRRVLVNAPSDAMAIQNATNSALIIATKVNSAVTKTFYACPSGSAKVILNKQLKTYGLLDNVLDVLMISRRVYNNWNFLSAQGSIGALTGMTLRRVLCYRKPGQLDTVTMSALTSAVLKLNYQCLWLGFAIRVPYLERPGGRTVRA